MMVDRIGQRLGNYRLTSLLSKRGASADVYEGENINDHTQVAVKVWKVQVEAKAFLNDVHAAVLDHPHIVKILDFDIEDDIPYLVMAYASNGTLQGQQLPLPLDTIVAYTWDITDALHYAHQRGRGCIIFCVSGQAEKRMKRKMEGERHDHTPRIDRRTASGMRRPT